MGDEQTENYVPHCTSVLWSELDKSLKDNNLSILTATAGCITGKSADPVTNSNLVRKRYFFIKITKYWQTKESDLVLVIIRYKSHAINRVGRTCGGIKIFHLEYIASDIIR